MENIDKVVEFLESEINRLEHHPYRDDQYDDYVEVRDRLKKYKTYARVNQSTDLERQPIDETVVPPYELKVNDEVVGNLNAPPVDVTLSDIAGLYLQNDINKDAPKDNPYDLTKAWDKFPGRPCNLTDKDFGKREVKCGPTVTYVMVSVPEGSLIVPPGMEKQWALQIISDNIK